MARVSSGGAQRDLRPGKEGAKRVHKSVTGKGAGKADARTMGVDQGSGRGRSRIHSVVQSKPRGKS